MQFLALKINTEIFITYDRILKIYSINNNLLLVTL